MNRNNCKAIHETYLKDIMDIWDAMKDVVSNNDFIPMKSKGPLSGKSSLAKASSNLTMVFPVICSRGIAIENSSMVSKAIEKNAVTMLQRMFSSWQVMDSRDDISSVEDYISQFHSNISSSVLKLDDIFKFTNSEYLLGESFVPSSNVFKNDMNNLDYYLPTNINESSLNEYVVRDNKCILETENRANRINDKVKRNFELAKTGAEFYKNQVVDTDFKKANELMPTSLVINFAIKDPKIGKIYNYDNAVIGVKAKLYPISSEDVVKHISEKEIDRNWITNFFRATTREISFMKDFVLALDKAKIDAMSMSTRNSTSDKMWKVLERRATISRLKRAMRQNNTAAAITTLCISQEEVEYLRKNYNVDVERIGTVLGLFESLNLMCICIVDESLEVAKFIYDEEEPMWETISFTHLERESSDNTYKRVVNLMTKISR